jgi:hypothetical protein
VVCLYPGHLYFQEIAPGKGLLGPRAVLDVMVKRNITMTAVH